MTFDEIKTKTEKELLTLIAEGRSRLHDLRLKRSMNQLKDVRELREIRKDIARMLTHIGAVKTK